MFDEKSCGVIPLRKNRGKWEVLLVQLHAGHWGFPKGHVEEGESSEMTARRELKEETGLVFQNFLTSDFLTEEYQFQRNNKVTSKLVIYYLAMVSGNPVIQQKEIKDSKWVPLSEVINYFTFPESQNTLFKLQSFLKNFE